MSATTRKAPGPEASDTAPAAAETPTTPAEPETVTVGALLEQAQLGLLTLINTAVSPETGHGVDVVLARQAAEVYHILFGESR